MRTNNQYNIPLGTVAGIATFCVATLGGVCTNQSPEIIAIRACGSSMLIGFAGFILGRLIFTTFKENE